MLCFSNATFFSGSLQNFANDFSWKENMWLNVLLSITAMSTYVELIV